MRWRGDQRFRWLTALLTTTVVLVLILYPFLQAGLFLPKGLEASSFTPFIRLRADGAARVKWTTAQARFGDYSAILTTGPSKTDVASVTVNTRTIPFASLNDNSVSFWAYLPAQPNAAVPDDMVSPRVVLALDGNGDGKSDADDIQLESISSVPVSGVMEIAKWLKLRPRPFGPGIGYGYGYGYGLGFGWCDSRDVLHLGFKCDNPQGLSTWQAKLSDASVVGVILVYGSPDPGKTGILTAYVDDVTIQSFTQALEPTVWVGPAAQKDAQRGNARWTTERVQFGDYSIRLKADDASQNPAALVPVAVPLSSLTGDKLRVWMSPPQYASQVRVNLLLDTDGDGRPDEKMAAGLGLLTPTPTPTPTFTPTFTP
ncbi:MAG: hypothetical protein HY686_04635, partial [Chloroflexi bacterium]|nr:hypothetical protein [Chloroflexota bacterium]